MQIRAHDQHYSFDYVAWVNAVFDVVSKNAQFKTLYEYHWGITPQVMGKFFRYEKVSLPTMLQIEFGSGVKMINFCVKID